MKGSEWREHFNKMTRIELQSTVYKLDIMDETILNEFVGLRSITTIAIDVLDKKLKE